MNTSRFLHSCLLCLLLAACGLPAAPPATMEIAAVSTSPASPAATIAAVTATGIPVATATSSHLATVTQVATLIPTATLTATAVSAQPSLTPTRHSLAVAVNGIPAEQFILLSPETAAHIRQIYAEGEAHGRNPHRLSRLGDSTIMRPHMLAKFDKQQYALGPYAYLQPTIDHFAGSLDRHGVATRVALHGWAVFDPMWANKKWCEPDEHMLACEFRLNNPSLLIIRLGSNDHGNASNFGIHMRRIIEYSLAEGVIPIIGTKPDRHEGSSNENNDILRELAANYRLPLWDFDLVAGTVPGRGLGEDGVHMIESIPPHDYTAKETFDNIHALHDLTALMMLHAVRTTLSESTP